MATEAAGDEVQCSFCGKSKKQVRKLITPMKVDGPGAVPYICNECVLAALDVMLRES